MKNLIFIFATLISATACAEWNTSLTTGWRIIGGANYNAGLKSNFHINGANAARFMPTISSPSGLTRAQAESAAHALENGGRLTSSNGGFIDPNYSGQDNLSDYTWNWYAPADAYQNGSLIFSTDYAEFSSSSSGSFYQDLNDKSDLPGFTIELQRNLGQWGNFGLDFAFGFNYFCRDNVFKSSGNVYQQSSTTERGTYTTSVDMDSNLADWARNADGSYGAGTFDGPGALLGISSASINYGHQSYGASSSSAALSVASRADYNEIEFTLTAKPYYDLTEWFRVVGTLGVAVSRGELDFSMRAVSNGRTIYSSREKFDQWDCYAIGGLGGMFHYSHVCLGFDFLARFFDDEIDVDGRDVNGSLERSNWMFRVYAGFEF